MSNELTRAQSEYLQSIALLLDEAYQLTRQKKDVSNDLLWCNLMIVFLAERFAASYGNKAPAQEQLQMALEKYDSDLREKMLNYYHYVLSVRATLLEQGELTKQEPEFIRWTKVLYDYVSVFKPWVGEQKKSQYSALNYLKVQVDPRVNLIKKLEDKIVMLKILQKFYQLFGFECPSFTRKILAFESLVKNLLNRTGHAVSKIVADWQQGRVIDEFGEHQHHQVLNEHRMYWLWSSKTTTAKLLDKAIQAENQVLGSCLKLG